MAPVVLLMIIILDIHSIQFNKQIWWSQKFKTLKSYHLTCCKEIEKIEILTIELIKTNIHSFDFCTFLFWTGWTGRFPLFTASRWLFRTGGFIGRRENQITIPRSRFHDSEVVKTWVLKQTNRQLWPVTSALKPKRDEIISPIKYK